MSFLDYPLTRMGLHVGQGVHKYENGWRWCGNCGEWRQQAQLLHPNKCPECRYKVRSHAMRGPNRRVIQAKTIE